MKRRQFIAASAGLTAGAICPAPLLATGRFFQTGSLPEPYADNRVIRVYDPKVSGFDFGASEVYWKAIDPAVLEEMLHRGIREVSGTGKVKQAWRLILNGNETESLAGKSIAVKVNFNNTGRDIDRTLNNSPVMLAALAKSLVSAGVQEEDISFFDCSRPFPETFRQAVRSAGLSRVKLAGKGDGLSESGKTIFLSDNAGFPRDGKPTEQYPIPQIMIDSDFLINLHLVKIHQAGVTGAMKNLFGISEIVGFYMHHRDTVPFEKGRHLSDISLNREIRNRARLNIAEFIFGGHTPDTIDRFTNEAFFPGGRPSSLVLSRSPFYHDTVLYDFLRAEYLTCLPVLTRFHTMGPDTWLQNAAGCHLPWKYERGVFTEAMKPGRPGMELAYQQLKYISI